MNNLFRKNKIMTIASAALLTVVLIAVAAAVTGHITSKQNMTVMSEAYARIAIPSNLTLKQSESTYRQEGVKRTAIRFYVYQYEGSTQKAYESYTEAVKKAGYAVTAVESTNQITAISNEIRITAVMQAAYYPSEDKGGAITVVVEKQ